MYLLKCLYQATKVRCHVFVKVPVPSHESETSCICALGISSLPLSSMFLLHRFWNCSNSVVFFVFHFIPMLFVGVCVCVCVCVCMCVCVWL
jgi:hypothetical protein